MHIASVSQPNVFGVTPIALSQSSTSASRDAVHPRVLNAPSASGASGNSDPSKVDLIAGVFVASIPNRFEASATGSTPQMADIHLTSKLDSFA